MTSAYQTAKTDFAPVLSASIMLSQKIEEAWKDIFAYNISRLDAAHAELTADKVVAIQKQFGTGSEIDQLLQYSTIDKLTNEIAAFNSDLAKRQIRVIGSCADVAGAEAVEDQFDSLTVALSIYAAVETRTGLAPLAPLVVASRATAQSRSRVSTAIRAHLATRACPMAQHAASVAGAAVHVDQGTPALRRALANGAIIRKREPASPVLRGLTPIEANARFAALLDTPIAQGDMLCVLARAGANEWSCDGGGQSYDGSFDPNSGTVGGANDGGYAEDNRQIESEINAASRNIGDRIQKLAAKNLRIAAAQPQWSSRNIAALTNLAGVAQADRLHAATERNTFTVAQAGNLAAAKQSLDDFLGSPFDPARAERLVTASAGSEMSLPTITAGVMVPDLPAITGITAANRVFGSNTSLDQRRIAREEAKMQAELRDNPAALALARREIALAKQFDALEVSSPFAQALVQDAKSLRYSKAGEIAHAGYSSLDGGEIRRGDLDPRLVPPATSLLARGEAFQASSALLRQQADQLGASLQQTDANSAPRKALVNTARDLDARASKLFFTGNPGDAEYLEKAAFGVLDLATRFVPGVSWGRDVYESITGKNLMTGEDLDSLSYAAALVGAITGGIADEALAAGQAVKALEECAVLSKVEVIETFGEQVASAVSRASPEVKSEILYILQNETHVAPKEVEFSGHALEEQLEKEGLIIQNVEQIIEKGFPFLDLSINEKGNAGLIYAIEKKLVKTQKQALVVVPVALGELSKEGIPAQKVTSIVFPERASTIK